MIDDGWKGAGGVLVEELSLVCVGGVDCFLISSAGFIRASSFLVSTGIALCNNVKSVLRR